MKNLLVILIIALFIAGCYVIPGGVPVLPDHTISVPLGDTTISFLEIAEKYPESFRIAGDTVYAMTKLAQWRTEGYAIPCSLQAHLNIEENLPEDWIDLDSTVFTTSVDKIINTVHIWGNVPINTNGRIRHYVYDRDRNRLYLDSMFVYFPVNPNLDTIIEYEITGFPFGDYQHDVDVITEYGFMRIDSIDSYSEIALKFHMAGDRVMTVLKEQSLWIPNPASGLAGDDSTLLSPPDSTPMIPLTMQCLLILCRLNARNWILQEGQLAWNRHTSYLIFNLIHQYIISLTTDCSNTRQTYGCRRLRLTVSL